MRMLLTAVSIIIFNNQAALASDDPFADAKAGKIECFSPNTEKKPALISATTLGNLMERL